MSWQLHVEHRTGFEYEGEVLGSYNIARLTPQSGPNQVVISSSVSVNPRVKVHESIDYWGTVVHSFDVHSPHHRLEVTGRSTVRTAAAQPPPSVSIGWDVLGDEALLDRMTEFLAGSAMAPPDDHITELATELRTGRAPVEAAQAIVDWVHTNIVYERGVTGVETPATGVLAARRGVCQDFAHLAIALLRAARIPARYVSGYLHPDPDAPLGVACRGESHAWVEAWIGSWWPVDPTNRGAVGERHVRVAHGRDYRDVPPLQGIFHGAPSKALLVSVELTRVA